TGRGRLQTCPYAISPLPPPHPDLGAAYLFPDPGKVACHLERGFQGLNAVELLWQGPLPDEGMDLRVTGGRASPAARACHLSARGRGGGWSGAPPLAYTAHRASYYPPLKAGQRGGPGLTLGWH